MPVPVTKLELNIELPRTHSSGGADHGSSAVAPLASPMASPVAMSPSAIFTPGGSAPYGATRASSKAEILRLVKQVEKDIQAQKAKIKAARKAWAAEQASFELEERAWEAADADAAAEAEQQRRVRAKRRARRQAAARRRAAAEAARREQEAVEAAARQALSVPARGSEVTAGGEEAEEEQEQQRVDDADGTLRVARVVVAANLAKAQRAERMSGKRAKLWCACVAASLVVCRLAGAGSAGGV
jgi:hypothetical protein